MSDRDGTAPGRREFRSWLRPRRVVRLVALVVLVVAVTALGSIIWIRVQAAGGEYSAESVPVAEVALIPGAQVYGDGRPSPYLAARLDIGRDLLVSGKVKALLLSGDNGTSTYDEPTAMRAYLLSKGVPADKIVLDYAGFSTYESCVRAYRVFGVRTATVVTQDFSLPRTVTLCRHAGIETSGVGDAGQPHTLTYDKCWLRDQVAATKAVVDMLTGADPTFLGNEERSVRDAIDAPMKP